MEHVRVGLLTYFHEDNPGQYWQAYWTIQALKDHCGGMDVEVPAIYPWRKSRVFGLRDLLRPSIFIKKIYKRTLYRRARALLPISRSRVMSASRDAVLNWLRGQRYDLLVVGADVAIKYWPERFQAGLQPFLVDPSVGCPYAFLAASSDITDWCALPDEIRNVYHRSVNGALTRAVRDTMTEAVFRSAGVAALSESEVVPDPTFYALPVKDELDSFFAARLRRFIRNVRSDRKKLLGVNVPPGAFKNELLNEATDDWIIVDMGPRPTVGSWWGWGGPRDWEYLISKLDGIITSSFHESAYAIKYGIPVVSVDAEWKRVQRRTGLSKLRCLHNKLGVGRWRYLNAADAVGYSRDIQTLLLWIKGSDITASGHELTLQLKTEYTAEINRLCSHWGQGK